MTDTQKHHHYVEIEDDNCLSLICESPDDSFCRARLNREIAERLADREPLHGNTYQIGSYLFKRTKQRNKTVWDVDHLKRDLYRRAVDGTDYISPDGELMLEPEQRVYDLITKVFTLTPKVTPLKERNIDPDEYREVEYGDSYQIQQL